MEQSVLNHFRNYSRFTYPGLYEEYLKTLPDDITQLGKLIKKQLIHRTTLENGLIGADAEPEDIKNLPWWKQDEDDYFNTAAAILAELFRRDGRGIVSDRNAKDKLILTCRHTTLVVAAVLKAKGIPARVRSGYAPYFKFEGGKSSDHWINEYWNKEERRWVIIDADGSGHDTGYNMFDLPKDAFDFPAVAWLNCRNGKDDESRFFNAKPATGLKVLGWALFYDFHCLMNNEITYVNSPKYLYNRWDDITPTELEELDRLATFLLDPDKNFNKLVEVWNTEKKFRILKGGLL